MGTKVMLNQTGLRLDRIDAFHSSKALAARAIAVAHGLELDLKMDDPTDFSGAFLPTRAIHEQHRGGGHCALPTTCVGGGRGIAAVLERL